MFVWIHVQIHTACSLSPIYILTERCMFMPHSLKQDFPVSIHRGLSLSNLLFLFAQGLVYKMEHHHHFSSYLTVCLSYWDRILLFLLSFAVQLPFLPPWHSVTSLKAFLALCYLGQSHPISTYIVGVCAALESLGQNPACGSSLRQDEQGVKLQSFVL